MKTVEITLKVQYLTMFGKRGYFDTVTTNVSDCDPRRITLHATMPEKTFNEAKKICHMYYSFA